MIILYLFNLYKNFQKAKELTGSLAQMIRFYRDGQQVL